MKTMTVGELKSRFSEVVKEVRQGESIILCFGRRQEKIAVIMPYNRSLLPEKRKIGRYQDQLVCEFTEGFSFTDQEFLRS